MSACGIDSLQTDFYEENWTPNLFMESLSDESHCTAYLQLAEIDQQILAWSLGGLEMDSQIAQSLGMTSEAVKKRRQRALARMERHLVRRDAHTGTQRKQR
jgi:hypothetical protein